MRKILGVFFLGLLCLVNISCAKGPAISPEDKQDVLAVTGEEEEQRAIDQQQVDEITDNR